ncbi:MAG: hypothetical protein F6K50_24540 [Moorea sp. SIO3I7]|nr:hypothetical protein [Moorena sp. SIO3I7]
MTVFSQPWQLHLSLGQVRILCDASSEPLKAIDRRPRYAIAPSPVSTWSILYFW